MLETGAAPLDDLLHDRISGPPDVGCRASLASARAAIEAGPASAVELYEAGLPIGLPGGLAEVAIDHRETLLEKVMLARRLRRVWVEARTAAKEVKTQGKMRKDGQYDVQRKMGRTRLMAAVPSAKAHTSGGTDSGSAEAAAAGTADAATADAATAGAVTSGAAASTTAADAATAEASTSDSTIVESTSDSATAASVI